MFCGAQEKSLQILRLHFLHLEVVHAWFCHWVHKNSDSSSKPNKTGLFATPVENSHASEGLPQKHEGTVILTSAICTSSWLGAFVVQTFNSTGLAERLILNSCEFS